MRPLSSLSRLVLPGGGVSIPGANFLCALATVTELSSFLRLFSSLASSDVTDLGGGDPILASNPILEPIPANGCDGPALLGFAASTLGTSALGVVTSVG